MDLPEKQKWISEIISILKTKSDADIFLSHVEQLSDSIYNNKTTLKEKMKDLFPSEMTETLNQSLKKAGVDTNNIIEIQQFLDELKNSIKKTPVINLTIAFKPKQQSIQRIYDWVSLKLKRAILLNFTIEKQIIGGAIVEFHGKYFEYTIHKALNEKIPALTTVREPSPAVV